MHILRRSPYLHTEQESKVYVLTVVTVEENGNTGAVHVEIPLNNAALRQAAVDNIRRYHDGPLLKDVYISTTQRAPDRRQKVPV